MNLFDELKQRGLIAQMTHEDEIKKLMSEGPVTFYIGFDPTADSLHVGHFLQMVIMAHMQKAGHKPIALFGGGTGMVGDPSGKTDMRRMLTIEEIDHNIKRFQKQFERFIDFSDGKAIMVNNKDWLLDLNYISFLREIGVHFSVNRMLSFECFKSRLEKGLSFIEFNYMLMQSYDFLVLSDQYDCKLELGGDDQWSNIIGGVELIRRARGKSAYGMTFTLLTTSEGKKMGKTESGAVWLDPEKTSPFDFYQYWRNVDDKDVIRCIKMLTFIPLAQIAEMEKWEGNQLNEAKQILAYELTMMVHGNDAADKAKEAALALFSKGQSSDNMPSTQIEKAEIEGGKNIIDLLMMIGLLPSKAEGRRLIEQGGLSVNDARITDLGFTVDESNFIENEMIIKKGKKTFHRVVLI